MGTVNAIGTGISMIVTAAANGHMAARNRRVAYENARYEGQVRDDEVAAFAQLAAAYRSEKRRADLQQARADALQKRVAELERTRLRHGH